MDALEGAKKCALPNFDRKGVQEGVGREEVGCKADGVQVQNGGRQRVG